MKLRTLCLSVCFSLAVAVVAWAANIDGKWTAQVPGRGGQTSETTFTFKAEGDKLTGTMSGRQGDTAISDGKIAGDDISFNVVRDIQGNQIKLVYKGKVAGDEIKFTRTIEGGPGGQMPPQEFTAKRVK
jgi:hypothetical protein